MRKAVIGIAVELSLLAFTLVGHAPAAAAGLRAGAFAMDVTPKLPISLNGGMTDRKATAIHDRLHARCLVLAEGPTRLAIVVVDSCMVPDNVVADAKRRIEAMVGIPPDHVLISATHTHTAPTLAPTFQSDPAVDYVSELPQHIAAGVQHARDALQPATLSCAIANVPDQVFNRRWHKKAGTIPLNPLGGIDHVQMNPGVGDPNLVEPAGPTDPEVVALVLRNDHGRPIALLANYSLHYVGDVQGDAVSADYFGAFAKAVGSKLTPAAGPGFVAIMSNGSSGNINNIDFRKPRPRLPMFGRTQLVADEVAKAVASAVNSAQTIDASPLTVACRDVTLQVRKPTPEEITRAERIVAAANGQPLRNLPEIYAKETLDMAKYPNAKTIRIQAIRIGGVGIVAIPCEVFVEIGLDIKRQSPLERSLVISLANGYSGYLPTAEHHRLGGYETWRAKSSFLEVGAAAKVQQIAVELLNQLAASKTAQRSAAPLAAVEIVQQVSPAQPAVDRVAALTRGPKHHFFGYYGVDPWNASGRQLACLEVDFGNRLVHANDRATVCLVDEAQGRMERLAHTTAWNHQQGAMLFWRGAGEQRELLFNDRVDGRLASIALDCNGKRRTIARAIAALSPDGSAAISLNFDRLRAIRPVTGYAGGPQYDRMVPRPDDDGLFLVDTATGASRLLVSIAQCWRLEPLPEGLSDQAFWLEHPIFSKDGKRVFFMIRAHHPKTRQLVSLPLCMDCVGGRLKALLPWGVGGASHFDWLDGHQLALTRLVRPGAFRHLLVDVDSGKVEELAPETLKSDGHCSFSPDRKWMITDTYPDKNRRQHLYLMNVRTRRATRVASFHAPPEYRGDWRCDLHPRWHRNSSRVCVDSTHDGVRQVYVAELRLPD